MAHGPRARPMFRQRDHQGLALVLRARGSFRRFPAPRLGEAAPPRANSRPRRRSRSPIIRRTSAASRALPRSTSWSACGSGMPAAYSTRRASPLARWRPAGATTPRTISRAASGASWGSLRGLPEGPQGLRRSSARVPEDREWGGKAGSSPREDTRVGEIPQGRSIPHRLGAGLVGYCCLGTCGLTAGSVPTRALGVKGALPAFDSH
jgi:hypothetical protein